MEVTLRTSLNLVKGRLFCRVGGSAPVSLLSQDKTRMGVIAVASASSPSTVDISELSSSLSMG